MANLAIGLKRRDHAISIYCYALGDLLARPLYQEGIRIHWNQKKYRYSLDVVFKLRKLMQNERYDAVMSFMATPNFYTILAGISLWRSTPVIVSERSCDYPGWITKKELYIRYLYRYTDHITVNSNHQRIHISSQHPIIKNKLSTIYNGYDMEIFTPASKEPDNNPLNMLVISRVSRHKNGICLIEALKLLKDKYNLTPQVDWIGQHIKSGDCLLYLHEMQSKIQHYGLEKQWNWLGQRTDIINQLHQHDVLVHPSFVEGLPNVVCEALACARPVIISNVLDHPFLVQNNNSGLLFNHEDPEDLAEKILNFSQRTIHERTAMGQCGRHYAEEHLSLPRYIDEYENLFHCIGNMRV
jgi:GalNAc-alpha-(1->4)-GalNAc-alpha-(1->3)-diNAcBac-PP-undecaprenol alpha-1,4-N-acetyl-D-galactosaminyltransferase